MADRDDARQRRAYGTWPSPIGAADVARSHGALSWVEQAGGALWWVESRPDDDGRQALMREDATGIRRVSAPGANLRNRVHEYGGLPWALLPGTPDDAAFCYTEWSDHRLYHGSATSAPRPLTPRPELPAGFRYAEPVAVGNEVWALREHHPSESPTHVVRDFVAVPLDGSAADGAVPPRVLGGGTRSGGHHFLAGLRVSPDGARAAWLGWNHPDMPWDRTDLVVADIEDGVFVRPRVIVGGAGSPAGTDGAPAAVSVCQVEWEPDGSLVYLSDESGWWNLHTWDAASGASREIFPVDAELGGPLWRPGTRWFAPLGGGRYAVLRHGVPAILDSAAGTITEIPGTAAHGLPHWSPYLSVAEGRIASVGYGPASLPRLVSYAGDGFRTHGDHDSLPTLATGPLGREWLPQPEFSWFTGEDGVRVPANVYRPTHPDVRGLPGELPPVAVHIHGGPTGENGVSLDLEIVYFTSRGIGVVAPEYGGSTGFGRAWRERLRGQWGVVDLADAQTAARGLVAQGAADPDRLIIRGGSAGGFTSAAAMTTPSVFAVGCVRYPVIDLVAWASGETHDFESQYLTGLVGRLPTNLQRYRDRSPSERATEVHGPMLILQGLDDRICLPVTTQRFVDMLAAAGKPHRYVAYEGEQHGFRKESTIAHAIATEFAFVCDALGIDPVAAENPDAWWPL